MNCLSGKFGNIQSNARMAFLLSTAVWETDYTNRGPKCKTTDLHCGVARFPLLSYFFEEKQANFISSKLYKIVC